MNEENPLVSIIVITYNSSKYVLETLESAKAQTYRNIELIVSDDASTDNTVEICREWIEKHKDRFVRTEVITVPENTGIPANCNRGVRASQGEWVKLIAGDDVLMSNCIKSNISYIHGEPLARAIFSLAVLFHLRDNQMIIIGTHPNNKQKESFIKDAESQYKSLLISNFNWSAPSSFLEKEMIEKVGYFDEEYPFFEDYPFWLKITKAGIKMYFLDIETVYYRQEESITRVTGKWINEKYFLSYREHFRKNVAQYLKIESYKIYVLKQFYMIKANILINIFGNRKSLLSKIFNRFYNFFIHPIDL